MFIHESMALKEAYDNLISNVSLGNIYAFLTACWLIGVNQTLLSTTLERIVYAEGDQQEIYTRLERRIINTVSNSVFSRSFQLESHSGNVDCRFYVIELASEGNVIFDSIATMKILNKAIDGLNIYMFISPTGVHFGCSSLTTLNTMEDCILAYAINDKTNWEQLSDALLFRNDSQSIYKFYSDLILLFDSIKYCRDESNIDDDKWELVNYKGIYDNDFLEDASRFNIEDYLMHGPHEQNEKSDNQSKTDVYCFEQEVLSCMSALSEIKKTHVNPLEMLFEAEKTLFVSEQEDEQIESNVDLAEDLPDIDLLDDPIALMKKLKKDRGI